MKCFVITQGNKDGYGDNSSAFTFVNPLTCPP